MKIHPTAIVEAGAMLGADVEIGPYACVGPMARLGDGCKVRAHAVITDRVTMGANNIVGFGTVIGSEPQDFAHTDAVESEVWIGDGNTFREHVTIHRGTKPGSATVVGSGCYLMTGSHLAHNVRLGDRVVIANAALLGGYVEVGSGAVLGGAAVFHQGVRVGRLCMVQGNGAFSKDLPPFTISHFRNEISGLNLMGLKRAGVPPETRAELKGLYRRLFRGGRALREAVAEAERDGPWSEEAGELMAFIREATKKGVCPAHREGGAADAEPDSGD